jgi:hypothetical protein
MANKGPTIQLLAFDFIQKVPAPSFRTTWPWAEV